MKIRSFLGAATLCVVATMAHAQQTRSALSGQNNSEIKANGVGAITGTILNGLLGNIINSMGALTDTNSWTGANTFSNASSVWNGAPIGTTYGGMYGATSGSIAVGNGSSALPLFVTLGSGVQSAIQNAANASGGLVTAPVSTTAGGLYGATLNAIPYGGGAGTLPSFVTACASGVLTYTSGSVPVCATAIPSGVTATTQTQSDNSAKVATDAFAWATMPGVSVLNASFAGGADPTGTNDSAPAFRAAMASNEVIYVPPGTYRFKSLQTASCSAFNPPAVAVTSLSNFAIIGYGATIVMDNSVQTAGNPATAFMFTGDNNFQVMGLTIQGNRTNLNSGDENAGIQLCSDTNFHFSDLHFSGNYGGEGTMFAGDWLVNGNIDNIVGDAVGQCYDLSFLLHFKIGVTRALGADTNGLSSSGHIGNKCFSLINDTLNASNNTTGYSYTETSDVLVSGITESNMATGAFVSTGTNLQFIGNSWHDNPGVSAGASGIGFLIAYTNGGSFTSVGVPPSNITINDNIFNNGATQSGGGLDITANAISNSDVVANITIGGAIDNNNNAGANADTSSSAKLSNVMITSEFSGASQVTNIGTNLNNLSTVYSRVFSQVLGNTKAVQTGFAGELNVGGANATLSAGESGYAKISASGSAPGTGACKTSWVAGTTGGTCKMIAYCGTSTTPVTIIDNVGSGC